MTHEPSFDSGEPKTALIGLIMALIVVVLALLIVGLEAYFDRVKEQQVYVKVLAPVSEELRDLRAREDTELHSYKFLDRDKGLVRIPIERAMELLAAEAAAGKLPYPTTPTPVKKPEPPGGPHVPATK